MGSFFELTVPERGDSPVLVEVPHAGLAVPESVRDEVVASQWAILRDADPYVDQLWARAPEQGATLLSARVSRYVCDLNRSPDDVDAETVPDHPSPRAIQPRGVVWRLTTDGRPALARPLTYEALQQRLETFHTPYHETLQAQLERLRERFGFAIMVAGHSMPSVGRTGHSDSGIRRADIVPGSRGRTTTDRRVLEVVDSHFRAAGLTVRHDDPYRGGWSTGHYGQPAEGWHAVQIEVNRALYMNEATGEPYPDRVEHMRGLLEELLARLGRLDLR